MRIIALLLLSLLIGGCNSGSSPASNHSSADSTQEQANAITGTVSLRAGAAGAKTVSANAKLELTLVDISQQPEVPIASKVFDPVGDMPLQYSLPFDPDRINPDDVLVMHAKMTDGDRNFMMPLQHPVLTHNASSKADIVLVPELTPGEQMLEDYRTLKGSLGDRSIKVTQGSSLGDDGSRAWQIFKQNGSVVFIKDIADDFKTNARVQTNFAYRDGKPWAAVQEHKSSAKAQADTIRRAGWDKDGNLVLREELANGDTTPLATADATSLHKQAEDMYRKVGGK